MPTTQLIIDGTPVPVDLQGFGIERSYPAHPEYSASRRLRSPVTAVRPSVEVVEYRSPYLPLTEAYGVEALLSLGPVTLTGELVGVARMATPMAVIFEHEPEWPFVARVQATLWLDPEDP
jgi:hypothetical protein